ncbi:T9SS type A sorting domain-containing protein [bacterium]|nr:T9SS type A sorting domain-containing protein [bacterium]
MRNPVAAGCAILLAASHALGGASPVAAGIEPFPVSLVPAVTVAEVDSVITLDLYVDSLAAQFNAYEVTLQFDPAILEFVSASPGPLMFPSGCGSPFPIFSSTDSTVTYFITLLCAGASLDGPGVVSAFRFRALADGITPVEIVSELDSSFFDAGVFISPAHPTRPRQVSFADAWVAVGPDPTSGPATAPPGRTGLRIRPNPVRGATELSFETERRGRAVLEIVDVTGRRVFLRSWSALAAGEHREAWSGRGSGGERLPAGVYLVRVRDGQGVRTGKITLVR